MFLEQEVRRYKNAFLFDIDVISATYGRRVLQDNVAWADNHGSLLDNVEYGADQARIEPARRMSEIYTIEDKPIAFMTAAWVEALAMFQNRAAGRAPSSW